MQKKISDYLMFMIMNYDIYFDWFNVYKYKNSLFIH